MLPQTMLLADHGYDADWIREPAAIRWRVAKAIILASVLESSSGDFELASDQANSTLRTNHPSRSPALHSFPSKIIGLAKIPDLGSKQTHIIATVACAALPFG